MNPPGKWPIIEQITLADGSRVVLYDMPADRAHVVTNLVCHEHDGRPRWTAAPGQLGPDAFVAVRLDGELLQAWTWTGYMIWLDSGSGEEIKRVFTK